MSIIVGLFQGLLQILRDPGALIVWGGYPGLALVIFLETGGLIFFLPGDSLLLIAGFYAAKGDLSLFHLNALLIPMAIVGDACSYQIGKRMGSGLFQQPKARLFKPAHLQTARNFYDQHGGKAIILARFVPVIRTFVPVIAGMANMGYRRFAVFNIIGGVAWVLSMTVVGYALGSRFPLLLQHIEKVILAVIGISLLPALYEMAKARLANRHP